MGEQLVLEDIKAQGKTAELAQQWKENMLKFSNLQGKKLLLPLNGFIEKLNKEFPNIAVLINGKVKTRND